jgi:hypothetical protein
MGLRPHFLFEGFMLLVLLDPVEFGEWTFKASVNQDIHNIMVLAFNRVSHQCEVRYFGSDFVANVWMERKMRGESL